MKKIIAIILCAFMALPLLACGGEVEPAEPTPVPDEQETDTPADEPTEKPAEQPFYAFDENTLEYSDDYLEFILPEGYSVIKDTTADYNGAYERFMSFTSPDPALQANSVNYNVSGPAAEGEKTPLEEMTKEYLEVLFKSQLEQAFQTEVQIDTVNYEFTSLESCPAIIYEYTLHVKDSVVNQIVVMIEEGDMGLSITYTFNEEDWEPWRESVETIIPAAVR